MNLIYDDVFVEFVDGDDLRIDFYNFRYLWKKIERNIHNAEYHMI